MYRCFLRKCLRILLRIFYVFPVDRKKIVFCSFNGRQYSCNPKYIFEYILDSCPGEFRVVWILDRPDPFFERTRCYKRFSIGAVYTLLTARFIMDNLGFPSYLPKRKEQCVINTWHAGGAYKRCTREAIGYPSAEWADMLYRGGCTDVILSSCAVFSKEIPDIFPGFCGRIAEFGLPRNDLFFYPEQMQKGAEKARSALGGVRGKVALYAPTFRGNSRDPESWKMELSTDAIRDQLSHRFGGDFSVWVRFHPSQKAIYGTLPEGCVDVSGYPDMQELLCAADILITDYSSSIWDYALTGRPCFLYTPDLESYQRKRGFYTPIEEWPGVLSVTEEELLDQITKFDASEYRRHCQRHLEKMGSFEQGNACRYLTDLLLNP